ncbi:type-F conjugative transfer system protein TraW [Cronobacter turicensis]
MKVRCFMVLMMTLTAFPLIAKDLGTVGHLFGISEPDMLQFIQQRLSAMQDSGELDKLKNEAIERVKRNAVRPQPVPGLTAASESRSFTYDPTFTVAETITDMSGRMIARKGDRVNPLDRVPYNETLFFIDGDNADQMAWIRNEIGKTTGFKVILVNGNIRETSEALDEPVYFDQAGVLTTKFGFTHIPVRITRDDRVLKVEEIALKGVKK